MAKHPENNSNNISEKFQFRIKQIIEDQDCDKKDFPKFVGVSKDVIIRATKYGIIPSLKSLIKIADKIMHGKIAHDLIHIYNAFYRFPCIQ